MKKSLLSRFASLLLICLFMIGFQQMAEAQFKLQNNTGCLITLKAGQNVGCSACNPSGLFAIPPGGIFVWNPVAACGIESWLGFKYIVGPIGGGGTSGVSYNPDFGGGCGASAAGVCPASGPVTATWFTSGSGTGGVKVLLN